MSFQLVDFDILLSDSENDIDFTAETMAENLVEIDKSMQLDDAVFAEFVNKNKAKNTVTKTKSDLNIWYRWCETIGEKRKIEDIDDMNQLNKLLSHFFMTVKKIDGSEYEPSTLRDCQRSIDRHLTKNCNKTYSILRDIEFTESREVLASKAKYLRREEGKGRKPNRAEELLEEDILKLWECGQLGFSTPRSLLNTVWLYAGTVFGWRGNEEHYKIRYGDVIFREGDTAANGEKSASYYEWLVERGTKTRDGSTCAIPERQFNPKMWSIGGERCPVKLFSSFLQRRPESMKTPDSPLYLAVIDNPVNKNIWYKAQRLGEKPLKSMLKNMAKAAGINKKISNHSARRTMIRMLKNQSIDRYDICQLTGHRNPKSLDEYSSLTNKQQNQLASIISHRVSGGKNENSLSISQSCSSTSTGRLSTDATQQSYFGSHSVFNGCTFNFQVSAVQSPPKKRKYVIYSSAESSQES